MSDIILTAADSISYPDFPNDYFAVPNDRIGTGLRAGEGLLRDGDVVKEVPIIKFLKQAEVNTDIGADPFQRPKALTYDENKAPLAYVPWAAIDEMALVQAYGQKKYGDFYNYKKGLEVGRNLSCAIRHIRDFMNGVDVDSESGRSHLAHAMCRLAFTIQNMRDGTAIDDRWKPNGSHEPRGK
jgi:hypothetical protein